MGEAADVSAGREWIDERDDDSGVSPCFVNCGAPVCQTLGCLRVYNARRENEQNGPPRV